MVTFYLSLKCKFTMFWSDTAFAIHHIFSILQSSLEFKQNLVNIYQCNHPLPASCSKCFYNSPGFLKVSSSVPGNICILCLNKPRNWSVIARHMERLITGRPHNCSYPPQQHDMCLMTYICESSSMKNILEICTLIAGYIYYVSLQFLKICSMNFLKQTTPPNRLCPWTKNNVIYFSSSAIFVG